MKTITSKSGKKITLRPPRSSDLQALYQYAKAIEAEDTFILLNPAEPATLKEEQEYLDNLLKDLKAKRKVYILALDQDKVIGSSHVQKQGRRQGHLGVYGISLLKSYRSSGIGRQLTQYIFKLAQTQLGITQIILECFANNHLAVKFYHSLGFKQYGRLPQGVKYKAKLIDKLYFYKPLS